jgi:predicted transcriptional regulator
MFHFGNGMWRWNNKYNYINRKFVKINNKRRLSKCSTMIKNKVNLNKIMMRLHQISEKIEKIIEKYSIECKTKEDIMKVIKTTLNSKFEGYIIEKVSEITYEAIINTKDSSKVEYIFSKHGNLSEIKLLKVFPIELGNMEEMNDLNEKFKFEKNTKLIILKFPISKVNKNK